MGIGSPVAMSLSYPPRPIVVSHESGDEQGQPPATLPLGATLRDPPLDEIYKMGYRGEALDEEDRVRR